MKLTVKELVIFALLGAVMLVSKVVMEFLPNIHLLSVLIVAYTVVYRQKALYAIYTYIGLQGLIAGFATWWIPYLYVWTVLWAVVMILPRNLSGKTAVIVYTIICMAHGLLFGALCAPAYALLYQMSFEGMLAWIAAGLTFDLLHVFGNGCLAATVTLPMIALLRRVQRLAPTE